MLCLLSGSHHGSTIPLAVGGGGEEITHKNAFPCIHTHTLTAHACVAVLWEIYRTGNSLKLLPRVCGKESVEGDLSPNFSVYIKVQTIHEVLICFGTQQPQPRDCPHSVTDAHTITHTHVLQSVVCQSLKLLCSFLQQTHPRCLMVGECPLMAPLLQSCSCESLGTFVFRNLRGRRGIWGHLVKRKDGRSKGGVVRRMRRTGENVTKKMWWCKEQKQH